VDLHLVCQFSVVKIKLPGINDDPSSFSVSHGVRMKWRITALSLKLKAKSKIVSFLMKQLHFCLVFRGSGFIPWPVYRLSWLRRFSCVFSGPLGKFRDGTSR
jgi:hypothetical protein